MEICFADESHHRYAQQICDTIQDAAQKRGTGIANRTPEYICTRMTNGNAVIALDGDRFTGYHRDLQLTKPIVMNAFEQLIELLAVFIEVLPEIRVNEALAQHEKYQYIWSVDTLNKWVSEGMPFREAYQKMAQSIADQSYAPDTSLKHVHLGSKDQLGLDHIKQKLDSALQTGRLS
jgi:argininosuccinate lyase